MNRGVFFALLAFAAVLLVLALLLVLLWPFLRALAWAGIIALAAQPLHAWFLRRTGGRRNVAAGLSTALAMLLIAIPTAVLGGLFVLQSVQVVTGLEQALAQGKLPGREALMANPYVSHWLELLSPYLPAEDLRASAQELLRWASTLAMQASRQLAVKLFAGLLRALVTIIVLFFAFRDGKQILRWAWEVIPLKASDKELLTATVRRVIYAVLYGVVLTHVVQGTLAGAGFALAGLPSPVFFGAIMILAAFIPVVGAAVVWLPAVGYLFAMGQMGRGAFLLGWCVLLVSTIDNFVRPLLIGGKAKVPLLAVILGVLGGIYSFGMLGVALGPLLLVVFLELFRIYRDHFFRPPAGGAPDTI